MKVRYIGSFPPPYGGVTVKNQLLFDEISKHFDICQPGRFHWMPPLARQVINCLLSLMPGQTLIIGISSKGGKSLLQTKLLYHLNRNSMKRSIYFVMGGQEANRIADDPKQIVMYSQYKQIYVEIGSMKKRLEDAGMDNVSVFPNCRKKYELHPSNTADNRRLQCVFFSLISPTKGVDILFDAAQELQEIEFHLYGEIENGYEKTFYSTISSYSNIKYHGIYADRGNGVYEELAKYDVMLLPTRWTTEGVPGALVEGKIAGITAIVSNVSYNAEIIKDGVEGIVLKDNTADELVQALRTLDRDHTLLGSLKAGNAKSGRNYFIENYTEDICKMLAGGVTLSIICIHAAYLKGEVSAA